MGAGPLLVGHIRDLVREAVDQIPDRGQQTRRLAGVNPHPDLELGPGWFIVQNQLTPAEAESAGDGYLRHGTARAAREYDVLEVVVAGEEVRVRTSATAPQAALDLYIPTADPRRILIGLAEGLEAVRDNPLLATFSQKSLTRLPVDGDLSSVHAWDELRPAQKQAVTACCAPGLQLVWGPPGTGKTHVIAAAIDHLAETGRRVLLVSSTDIAVDTALHEAIRIMQPEDGAAVRIGTVHLPALAADQRVNLARLTELRQSELLQRAAALEARIQALTGAEENLKNARAQTAGFDASGYQRASQRVANRNAQERQQHDLGPAEDDVNDARENQTKYRGIMLSLAYREATEQEQRARAGLASVEAELAALKHKRWTRMWSFRAIRRFDETRQELLDDVTRAESAVSKALDQVHDAGAAPEACGDQTREEIEVGRDSASGRLKAAETRLADIRRELSRLNTLDLAGSADQSRVTDEWPRWKLHNSLPKLHEEAEQERHQRQPIEQEYNDLQKQIKQDRRAIEQAIVSEARVVGTTFTQIALRPWITKEPFDHVIIDEAAAAQFPHLVHAVGHARVGAVLVGDYLQNGPIVDDQFSGGAKVKNLFKTDCFTFFGAKNPAEAKTKPGCVVLTEQFRLGPALTELANRVAYGNVLETSGEGAADIVVITVDGLTPALRTIYHGDEKQSGWWAIGALMARALAEHHQGSGSSFGVVTPYKPQVEATKAALEDAGDGHTPVGTAHSFQGRHFDTVLADLVEDGGGWVANVRLDGDGNAFDGVRLFNVAVTRPRNRLYILLTNRALGATRSGPLAVLRTMIAEGSVHRVDVGELLGLSDDKGSVCEPEAVRSVADCEAVEADLLAALDPYVRPLHDDGAAVEEVVTQINKATTSVWCWSAWVAKDAEAILDALVQAHLRGVEVHLIALPPDEVQLSNPLPHVVFMHDMHQKIVITDRRWSIVGSTLPDEKNPRMRDSMLTLEGPKFAEQLLTQEMADELVRQRFCRQCHEPLRECRETGREPKRRWVWLCANGHSTPFPDGHTPR